MLTALKYNEHNYTIMDFAFMILTVLCSALVQTGIIVFLYQKWIIPQIVEKVRDELMGQIQDWVDSMTLSMNSTIQDSLSGVQDSATATISIEMDKALAKMKSWIGGKRGKNAQLVTLAESYLDNNLSDDLTDDQRNDVISEAVLVYGKSIVDALIKKRESPTTTQGGW